MDTNTRVDSHPLAARVAIYFVCEGGYAVLDDERCCYIWYWDIPRHADDDRIGSPLPEGWGITPFNDLAKVEWGEWLAGSRR